MGQIAEVEKIIKSYKAYVIQNSKERNKRTKDMGKPVSYTAVRNIYNLTINVIKNNCNKDDIEYLKMKIVYQLAKSGGESGIKEFVSQTKILTKLDEIIQCKEEDFKNKVKNFKIYMEAVVSYFKYYIGDN